MELGAAEQCYTMELGKELLKTKQKTLWIGTISRSFTSLAGLAELLSNLVFATLITRRSDRLYSPLSVFEPDPGDHLSQITETALAAPVLLCTLAQLEDHVQHPVSRQAAF